MRVLFKRGYTGTYHQMITKHLHRYVTEFTGRLNDRPLDTRDQVSAMVHEREFSRDGWGTGRGTAARTVLTCAFTVPAWQAPIACGHE